MIKTDAAVVVACTSIMTVGAIAITFLVSHYHCFGALGRLCG